MAADKPPIPPPTIETVRQSASKDENGLACASDCCVDRGTESLRCDSRWFVERDVTCGRLLDVETVGKEGRGGLAGGVASATGAWR